MRIDHRFSCALVALLFGLALSHVPSGYAASDEPDSYTKIGGKKYGLDIDMSPSSRWALYATNKLYYLFFYDTKSIARDNEIIRVWTKLFSPKGEEYSFSKKGTILKEVNCKKRQVRELEWNTEGWDGKYDGSSGPTKWENIRPETVD